MENNKYNDAWLSGFIGGEGCFALQVHKHSKNGYDTLTACFTVKLRKDDEEILVYLQKRLDCGVIRYRSAYAQTKPSAIFSVSNIGDLKNKVIPFFEQNPLLNKKQTDFEIFKEGIEYISQIHSRMPIQTGRPKGRSKWTKDNWDFIKSLTQRLKENRSFNL